jgi:hypothetical protein
MNFDIALHAIFIEEEGICFPTKTQFRNSKYILSQSFLFPQSIRVYLCSIKNLTNVFHPDL